MNYLAVWSYDNFVPVHPGMGGLHEEGINCWLKDENTACGSSNLKRVSMPCIVTNWFSALSTFLPTNYPLIAEKVYHCFDRGHEATVHRLKQADTGEN